MRYLRLSIALLLLLLSTPILRAQWSGSVNATGGFGAVKSLRGQLFDEEDGMPKALFHELGQTTLRLNYNNPQLQWSQLLEGKIERKSTDNYHITLSVIDKSADEKAFDMNAIVKMNEELPVNAQYRSDLTWRPAPGQRFAFWARYNLKYKGSENLTYRAGWKTQKESLSQEAPVTWDHTVGAGFRSTHELGRPRRVLTTEFSYDMNYKRQVTMYTTFGSQPGEEEEEDIWMSCYILTPQSGVSTYKTIVHYRDSLLNGPVRLTLNPGLRFTGIHSLHENSGATLVDVDPSGEFVWRDSTQIREWFSFSSLDFQPYVAADFSWKKLRVHLDYGLSLYARKLTDSVHFQGYKFQSPMPLGNGRIDWNPHPNHKISLSNNLTVKHPTYLQVCWFDRSGGYIEQLYRGSEALRSTRTIENKLGYSFTYKRFTATTDFSYSRRLDEIEQTWFKEEIDHRHYKVFTWLNGADSRIFNVSPKLGWRGQMITANMGVECNYTIRTWRDSDKVKKTTDWRLTADITARLPKGWTLSADMKYQSAVATFFALFKQYCVLNTRAQKEFKHFIVSLEARDLLDMPVEAEYISEDETEAWTEKTLHNRRLILLGISWKF